MSEFKYHGINWNRDINISAYNIQILLAEEAFNYQTLPSPGGDIAVKWSTYLKSKLGYHIIFPMQPLGITIQFTPSSSHSTLVTIYSEDTYLNTAACSYPYYDIAKILP